MNIVRDRVEKALTEAFPCGPPEGSVAHLELGLEIIGTCLDELYQKVLEQQRQIEEMIADEPIIVSNEVTQ